MGWFDAAEDVVEKGAAQRCIQYASFFMGDIRDGVCMINMQTAFLIVSKGYTEKQAGILFLVFGISQFIFQTPAGYLYDYTDHKISWLTIANIATTCLTLVCTILAAPNGENLLFLAVARVLQGAATAFIPPGFSSITQGIVGVAGMSKQMSTNRMMNHFGTVLISLTASLFAVALYPDIGLSFIVSPLALAGIVYFLFKIDPDEIDHNEARGLTIVPSKSYESYTPPPRPAPLNKENNTDKIKSKFASKTMPSFNFSRTDGPVITWADPPSGGEEAQIVLRPDSPLRILSDPILLVFLVIVFMYNFCNATVLPLVMQTVATGSGRTGFLLAGMCMVISQTFMGLSANLCGPYSNKFGRKPIFLIGLCLLPVRCCSLALLLKIRGDADDAGGFSLMDGLILSTQVFGGISFGIVGTLYIVVTSDISGGTGRFNMTLGLTTAATCIGGTLSGFLGEGLAQDLGYRQVFVLIAVSSLLPIMLYAFAMPETLPAILQSTEPTVELNKTKLSTHKESENPSTNYGIMA